MKLEPRRDLLVRVIDGEVVILDRANDKIHQFNLTASRVWNSVCGGKDPVQIAEELSQGTEIDVERATQDVISVVEQFRSAGLFKTTDRSTEDGICGEG